jgi:NAD(P) transhydrogenase
MMHFDVVVIGSGPAGQKAAVQAAKSGHKVCIVEQERKVGGAGVNRGTLPSKTLRESAMRIQYLKQHSQVLDEQKTTEIDMSLLVSQMDQVMSAHDDMIEKQTNRNLISRMPGRASLVNRYEVHVERAQGNSVDLQARVIVLATGSSPDIPESIPVDHEHVFDTESILNILYLPKSLIVVGSDIHACEYASIFAALGVQVTLVGQAEKPMIGLDEDVQTQFIQSFESMGGSWVAIKNVTNVVWDGAQQVLCELDDGQQLSADKLMYAPSRKANVKHLNISGLGIALTDDCFIEVNELLQTSVPNIFAAGDAIGPPALASTSMEQGRRAICNAFRIPTDDMNELIPTGVYAIPEIAAVGLTEAEALKKYRTVIVGRANFAEIVRGQISGYREGFLKIVCDDEGKRVLGVHIVGEGATELIHIGQLAILNENTVDTFIETVFNFPTLAEAYRIAALDVFGKRMKRNDSY